LIIALAARSGVPASYPCPVSAESRGLIAYGADLAEQFRQAAGYIDHILKGANPGDLPIQQPTNLELANQRQDHEGGRVEHPSCSPRAAPFKVLAGATCSDAELC
jgi:putative tryptophan/tyrosine transport system substrate-binding protein